MPIEGFWAQSPNDGSGLPFPTASNEDWDKQSFLTQLDKVEAHADRMGYRGWSTCRVCKCMNGSAELTFAEFTWPQGYRHYVAEHNIRPTPSFEEMIKKASADLPDNPISKLGLRGGLKPK